MLLTTKVLMTTKMRPYFPKSKCALSQKVCSTTQDSLNLKIGLKGVLTRVRNHEKIRARFSCTIFVHERTNFFIRARISWHERTNFVTRFSTRKISSERQNRPKLNVTRNIQSLNARIKQLYLFLANFSTKYGNLRWHDFARIYNLARKSCQHDSCTNEIWLVHEIRARITNEK